MAKKEKIQYPNPEFWRAKDEMNWDKQKENLLEVGGIFWDMLKETDWKAFGQGWLNTLKADGERIKGEYADFTFTLDKGRPQQQRIYSKYNS